MTVFGMYFRLTEIVVSFTEPGQKFIEAWPVVGEILLQHLDIGLIPGIHTAPLHQNNLNF